MRTRDDIQPLQFIFPPFSHFLLCRVSSPLAFAKSCCTKGFCNVAFRSFFPNKEVWHQLGQVSTRNWARSSNIPLMSVLGPLKSRDEKSDRMSRCQTDFHAVHLPIMARGSFDMQKLSVTHHCDSVFHGVDQGCQKLARNQKEITPHYYLPP